jgi:16S rRNA (cytosine967-C5)-methyltransferase
MLEAKRQRRHRGSPRSEAGPRRNGTPTQTRLLAVRVLERVERAGAYADLALHAELRRSHLTSTDRALATEFVYGTLRWRGRLDFLLSQVLDRDFDTLEPLVATLLRLGAYQIVFTGSVPDSAAVDQTVRCARAVGAERATGLVNAVLRRLARTHDTIPLPDLTEDPLAHLTSVLSLPPWIAERWLEIFGAEEAATLAKASNSVPPLTARVNPLRSSRQALIEELGPRLPDARPCRLAPRGVLLGHRGHPAHDPAFLEGRYTIQDEASQLVVAYLEPKPGERILDVCAAPGTKTTAIAEEIGDAGEVVALDRNARRLRLVGRDARRLGLTNITTCEYDAMRTLGGFAEQGAFDRILVDAPCSGLGTLRRNPDARWRVRPGDPPRLAEIQTTILRNAAAALRPGGVLVYSTCTLLPEENEMVVESLLSEARDYRLLPGDAAPEPARGLVGADGYLRCFPHLHDTDGFFAARLERNP